MLAGKSTPSSAIDSALQSRIDNAPWLVVNASVSRMWFLGEPAAVQRRLVKAIGEHARIPLEFKHVEEILRFAAEDGPPAKNVAAARLETSARARRDDLPDTRPA